MLRILAMPVVHPATDASCLPDRLFGRPVARTLLRPAQVAALAAAQRAGSGPWGPRGMVGMLGCGHGKTLVAQLLPAVFRAQRPLVLVPAALVRQFHKENAVYQGMGFNACIDGLATYETLSSPKQTRALFEYQPDLIVCDEAHMLGNRESARWKRVAKYLDAQVHTARFCALSGTLLQRSVLDMQHLLFAALRDQSPMPDPSDPVTDTWVACLDKDGLPNGFDMEYFNKLCRWAGTKPGTKEGCQKALYTRMSTCSGVAVSQGVSSEVELLMRRWAGPARPDNIKKALSDLDKLWVLPDGTELVGALDTDRAYSTLAMGYYHRWVDGTGHPLWFEYRKGWSKVVQQRIRYGGIESPALVEEAADVGVLSAGEVERLRLWRSVANQPPDAEVVWLEGGRTWPRTVVDAFLGSHGKDDPTVFWFEGRPVGEALAASGIPVHGGGSVAPTGGHAAASRLVHGKGWNGQHYRRQLVLEPMMGAAVWEQLLSRMHRPGQFKDVDTTVFLGSGYAIGSFERALDGAVALRNITGEPQRLLLATHESEGIKQLV